MGTLGFFPPGSTHILNTKNCLNQQSAPINTKLFKQAVNDLYIMLVNIS